MRVLLVSADRSNEFGHAVNVGDAMLSDVLAEAIRTEGHEVHIADFGGSRRNNDGERTKISGIRSLLAAVRNHDAVVVGGGTMIQVDSTALLRSSLMRLCAAVSIAGWVSRVPVAFFAVGCDPLPRRLARIGYRIAVWRREVWVRETESLVRFRGYFGRTPHLAADAALLYDGADSEVLESCPAARTPILAPNRRDGGQISASWLKSLGHHDKKVQLVAMSVGHDSDLDLVPQETLNDVDIVDVTGGWREVFKSFAGQNAIVASRMHALYFGLLQGLPMVAVGNNPKVVAFANEFQIPRIETYGEYADGLEESANGQGFAEAEVRARNGLEQLLQHLNQKTGRNT